MHIVYGGLFTAILILLTYPLAIQTPYVRVSLAFVPLAIYASFAGPYRTMLVAGVADFIGINIFMPGMFFPGFTLSAMINGFFYGYFLYNRPVNIKNILMPIAIHVLLINLVLNTLWLVAFLGIPFKMGMLIRVGKDLIMAPVMVAVLYKVLPMMQSWIQRMKAK